MATKRDETRKPDHPTSADKPDETDTTAKRDKADKHRELKLLYTNARSLRGPCKLQVLEVVTSLSNPDVVAITETWLAKEQSGAPVGYTENGPQDRNKGGGGGVAIYTRKGLPVKPLHLPRRKGYEITGISVFSRHYHCIYRPSHTNFAMNDALGTPITGLAHTSLVMGDLNLPERDWETHTGPTRYSPILDAISQYALSPARAEAHPRERLHTGSFIQQPDHRTRRHKLDPGDRVADHTTITFNVSTAAPQVSGLRTKHIIDYPSLMEDLPHSIAQHHTATPHLDCHHAWKFLPHCLTTSINKHTSLRTSTRARAPCNTWATKDVKALSARKKPPG
eukprot:GHVN01045805.1.p1 GENE.GHVN01045805.1~~GHVN01045805.1.p1  ORF type:complete len:337 (+),score=40.87 GHVN01045805.1:1479-2489(+)